MSQGRVFDAPTEQNAPIPAYKVVEVEGPFERERSIFDEKSRTIIKENYIIDKGYMVIFPRGHSMMLDNLEALEQHGFGEVVPLITLSQESEVNEEHVGRTRTTKRVINKDD